MWNIYAIFGLILLSYFRGFMMLVVIVEIKQEEGQEEGLRRRWVGFVKRLSCLRVEEGCFMREGFILFILLMMRLFIFSLMGYLMCYYLPFLAIILFSSSFISVVFLIIFLKLLALLISQLIIFFAIRFISIFDLFSAFIFRAPLKVFLYS